MGVTAIKTPKDAPNSCITETVNTVTINDIFHRYPNRKIGLIKLDIEGGEKVLFEEAARELSKIPLIFVELHDRIVDGCTEAFERHAEDRNVVKFHGEKYLSYVSPK